MPTPPHNHWTHNSFSEFRLVCIPEPEEEVPIITEDPLFGPDYPTTLGFIHIYLDGRNATGHLPSTHVFSTLMSFAYSIPKLYQERSVSFISTTEPFIYRIEGDRTRQTITLHYGWDGRDEAFVDNAVVPMLPYFKEVIRSCEAWLAWMEPFFYEQITHERFGSDYRWLQGYLAAARLIVAQLEAEGEQAAQIERMWDNGVPPATLDLDAAIPPLADHPQWQAIKAQLAAAQAEGRAVTLDIQALTAPSPDQHAVAADVRYSLDGQTFTHTFLEEPERVLEFLGVADAPAKVLLTLLRQLVNRSVSESWERATLIAEIEEQDHGLTYGRYDSSTVQALPFDTDYAVFAVFSAIRQHYSEQLWYTARFSVTPTGEMDLSYGEIG